MSNKVKRNYLEINSIENLVEVTKPSNAISINLIKKPDFQLNKFFYKEIGKKHSWVDRLSWNEKNWIEYLNNPDVKTYVLKEKNNFAGYFEQIFDNKKRECDILINNIGRGKYSLNIPPI